MRDNIKTNLPYINGKAMRFGFNLIKRPKVLGAEEVEGLVTHLVVDAVPFGRGCDVDFFVECDGIVHFVREVERVGFIITNLCGEELDAVEAEDVATIHFVNLGDFFLGKLHARRFPSWVVFTQIATF